MLAKGITFSIFDSGSFHAITSVTVFKLDGTKWQTEKTTSNDNTVPVETIAPTIRSDGTITLTLTSFDASDDYHALLKTLSESGAQNNFKITYPNSSLGSFEFAGYVTGFAFDTPVDGLQKANVTVTVYGAIGDDAAKIVSAAYSDAFHPTYVTGNVLKLLVTLDEAVRVTGTPEIQIDITSGNKQATYASGSGTNLLTFHYTVASGDVAAATGVSIVSPINLNSGTIKDMAGQAATLTFTPPVSSTVTMN